MNKRRRKKIYHYHGRGNGKRHIKKLDTFTQHIDNAWISSKIGEHGGAYGFNDSYGPAKISYIGRANKIKIWWLNMRLYWRWVKRRLKNA
jgi:hypothetical protein